MTWARIDDSILTHPKVAGLTAGAGWLWVRALVYCNRHLTDGLLVAAALRVLQARPRDLAELVDAGLVEVVEGEYRIHDFGDWNETRREVEHRRESWRTRQGDSRARARGGVTQSVTRDRPRDAPETPPPVTRDARVTHATVTRESLSPIPSHPIPSGDPAAAVDPGPGTPRAREPVPPTAAAAAAAGASNEPEKPEEPRKPRPEAAFAALLAEHPHARRLAWDAGETARVLAYAGDAKPLDQALAAARRALDEAGSRGLDEGQTLRLVRGHVERATERDLPGGRAAAQPHRQARKPVQSAAGAVLRQAETPPIDPALFGYGVALPKSEAT